ncbi:MAG: phosphate ABC transporter permease subunit PstC [Alphaproteobacteria bacterium]
MYVPTGAAVTTLDASNASSKAAVAKRLERSDATFRWVTWAAAFFVLLTFIGMFVALLDGAYPALRKFGLNFFVTSNWNPVTEKFGILHQIYGTLVTSAIAMLIATPIGIGIAVFLTELCPRPLRRPIGTAIELLAGIPSIIYGIWGLFVFAPFFQHTLQPWIIDALGDIPGLSQLFAGPPFGVGIFTASLILAIMILPLISSLTRDVFDIVPPVLKEAAYGLGCTVSEVTTRVVMPYARQGVVGASMLALGRALGETMAVTFVIGNANKISVSLFAPGTTISAAIANEFSEAVGDLYLSALLAGGLFLMFITFVVLAAAQLMLGGVARRAGAGN